MPAKLVSFWSLPARAAAVLSQKVVPVRALTLHALYSQGIIWLFLSYFHMCCLKSWVKPIPHWHTIPGRLQCSLLHLLAGTTEGMTIFSSTAAVRQKHLWPYWLLPVCTADVGKKIHQEWLLFFLRGYDTLFWVEMIPGSAGKTIFFLQHIWEGTE